MYNGAQCYKREDFHGPLVLVRSFTRRFRSIAPMETSNPLSSFEVNHTTVYKFLD